MTDTQFLVRLGKSVRKRRKKLGFTQELLAHEAGISVSHIRRIELGRVRTSVVYLFHIAKALKTTVSELTKNLY